METTAQIKLRILRATKKHREAIIHVYIFNSIQKNNPFWPLQSQFVFFTIKLRKPYLEALLIKFDV